MSKTLEATDLTRLAWTTALRTQGHRKCREALWAGPRVCAIAMLAEVLGENDQTFSGYDIVGAKAGLSERQVDEVIAMNDGKGSRTSCKWDGKPQSFAKIAAVIDGWFK